MKRFTLLGAVLAVFLLAPTTRAGVISWSYNWSPGTAVVQADAPGTSKIELTNEPQRNSAGDSNIVATNLRTVSTALPETPDHFTHADYSLNLVLTDTDSHTSGTLAFTGEFDGTISSSNSNLHNTFTGAQEQSLVLGDHTYTVTIGNFTPPGPPTSGNAGAISAFAKVDVEATT